MLFFIFKQKTTYEKRISDGSSDVCSSDRSDKFARRDEGGLVIACTHTQARYLLPKVMPAFRKRFPKVHVSLAEGNPQQLANMVLHEQADLAIATETLSMTAGLVTLPVYSWEHTVVVRPEDRKSTRLNSSH